MKLQPDAIIWQRPAALISRRSSGLWHRCGPSGDLSRGCHLFTIAYMLDEVDKAGYQEWKDGYLDMVVERVAAIPEDERVRVC